MDAKQMNTAQIEILDLQIRKLKNDLDQLSGLEKLANAFGSDTFDVEEAEIKQNTILHIRNARLSRMPTEDLWGTHPDRMNKVLAYPIHKVMVHWVEGDGPNFATAIEHFGPGCYAIRNGTVAWDKRVSHEIVGTKKESYASYCFRVETGTDMILAGL